MIFAQCTDTFPGADDVSGFGLTCNTAFASGLIRDTADSGHLWVPFSSYQENEGPASGLVLDTAFFGHLWVPISS